MMNSQVHNKAFRFICLSFVLTFFVATLLPTEAHASALSGFFSGIASSFSSAIAGLMSAVVSSVASTISSAIGTVSAFLSSAVSSIIFAVLGVGSCGTTVVSGSGTIGDVICNVVYASNDLPGFISAMAYMMGMIMAVTGLFKLKDHVINPGQTPLSDSMKRFVAGGALFMLPTVTSATETLINGGGSMSGMGTGVAGSAAASYGLDAMMVALIVDIYGPLSGLLGGFGYLAGLLFVVIGISRLLKTAQDGPSGPSGVGTIMTFIVAGVLFTLDDMMGAFSSSLFGDNNITTYATLATPIDGGAIDDHVLAVISSILLFMMLVGWVSFIRGFFLLRDVAEGRGQASLMAAITHIFGGALAVNLGPLMNAVQSTFGLTSLGVQFS